jgi:hypothetical protein
MRIISTEEMTMKQYVQCRLSQGTKRTIGYIEDRGALLGARVEIDELGGLWTVDSTGHQMSSEQLHSKQSMDRKSFTSVEARR